MALNISALTMICCYNSESNDTDEVWLIQLAADTKSRFTIDGGLIAAAADKIGLPTKVSSHMSWCHTLTSASTLSLFLGVCSHVSKLTYSSATYFYVSSPLI